MGKTKILNVIMSGTATKNTEVTVSVNDAKQLLMHLGIGSKRINMDTKKVSTLSASESTFKMVSGGEELFNKLANCFVRVCKFYRYNDRKNTNRLIKACEEIQTLLPELSVEQVRNFAETSYSIDASSNRTIEQTGDYLNDMSFTKWMKSFCRKSGLVLAERPELLNAIKTNLTTAKIVDKYWASDKNEQDAYVEKIRKQVKDDAEKRRVMSEMRKNKKAPATK